MWVQFQLGLHLLKVNCVICCFLKNKKFPFCKICFSNPSHWVGDCIVWPTAGKHLQWSPSVLKMVLGQVVNFPPSSLFHCRFKIHILCLWNVSHSLGNTHNNPHWELKWWLCACWVAILKPLLKCYRLYFVLKWWMVVGISTRIFYVVSVHANSLFIRRTDNVFKCVSFWNTLFLSFESLGHLVTTEYMLNLVIECEVSLTFNGSNLREYIPGHSHPCSFFFFSFCVKGQYHWISDVIYATPIWNDGKPLWINEHPRIEPCSHKWHNSLSHSLLFCGHTEVRLHWELTGEIWRRGSVKK